MGKKRREAKNSEDLISRLPDEVLTHILSYLTTTSSVATSVLSKRWSRLWLSVPNLDFDDCYFSSSISRAQFENFMDRFLSLNNVRSVRTIYFLLGWDPEVSRVNAWLAAFGDCDAEKVDLTLYANNEKDDLPLSLNEYFTPIYSLSDTFFNQNNLVKLRLTAVILKVPQLVCFPNLKKMTLRSVQLFDETSMKNLLCGSPVLKTLKLYLYTEVNMQSLHICSFSLHSLILHVAIESNHDYDVVIDSPNLTYLSLTNVSDSTYNITNASLLASAYIHTVTVKQLLKLLTQITHVKKLHFAIFFMSGLHEILHAHLPMLRNLIHLTVEVEMDDDEYVGDGGSLSRLLHCTPNIVTFSIKKDSRDDRYDWFEPYEVPPCFLSSIKSVDIKWVGDGDRDLQMIAYILKNAMVLNKLSIICDRHKLGVNKTKFITTLLTLPRSSATCEVEYNLEYNDRGLF